jgi:hypothetical protein
MTAVGAPAFNQWISGAGLRSPIFNFRFGLPETGSTCGRDRFKKGAQVSELPSTGHRLT